MTKTYQRVGDAEANPDEEAGLAESIAKGEPAADQASIST